MPLVSSKVAAGTEILADHFNKLREDLLTNHDHSSGKGGTVDHKDVMETASMSGLDHMHEDIDVHLGQQTGPGPTAIDNPGGDMGVHGLASAGFVMGSIDQNGTPAQLLLRCGVGTIGLSPNAYFDVTLSPPFSQIYAVTATYVGDAGAAMDQDSISVKNLSNAGFRVQCASAAAWEGHQAYWIAIGTLT